MTNFIKFYHFIISSLIIFILIGFVSNTALTSDESFVGRVGEAVERVVENPGEALGDLLELESSEVLGSYRRVKIGALLELHNMIRVRSSDRRARRRRTPITDAGVLETEVRDLHRNLAAHRRDIAVTGGRIRELERSLTPIVQAVQAECPGGTVQSASGHSTQFCVRRQDPDDDSGVPFYSTAEMSEASVNRYNEARNRQNAINGELRKEREELRRLQRGIEGLEDRITGAVPPEDRMVRERQRAMIEAQDLLLKVFELDDDLGDIDQALDIVEGIYDDTVLGAYLQDKIGQLLNSQVICEARKRCATGNPEKIDPKKIQDELFPTSTQTRGSYNHRRPRRIREGAR